MYACGACDSVFQSVHDCIQHIKACHPAYVFGLTCKFISCGRKYDSINSFRKHLESHNIELQLPPLLPVQNNVDNANNGLGDDGVVLGDNVGVNFPEHELLNITDEEFTENVANSAIRFISKMYSINTMNRSDVDLVLKYSNEFVQCIVSNIRLRVRPDNILQNVFDIAHGALDDLQTETQRFNALESMGVLINPVPFNFDYVPEIVGNIEPVVEQVPLTGQFVPIRSIFKSFFELEGVYKTVVDNYNDLVRTVNPVSNIVQGSLWKEVILPKFGGKVVLPITINYDDTEPDNSIGSHSGDHKLGPVYFSCPVIPQKYLGALKNMFLSCLFLTNHRNVANGNHRAFHLLIEELLFLENEGILIKVDGEEIRLYFALVAILGDNLGLHSILGFAEGFTANYSCRFCRMHRDDLQRMTHVPANLLRTVENYAEDVQTNNLPLTGVFEECVFNQLSSYHVITNPSVDIMHDILEGTGKYVMAKILTSIVYDRHYMSLETLIERVDDFFYGKVEAGNRLQAYKLTRDSIVGGSLNFSSSEMLCFIRCFGEMVGDLIPENDPVWNLFLMLRDIISIVFAPSFSRGTEELLQVLVQDHNNTYQELFRADFQPKFHFMLHYAHLMTVVGPLLHLSSMRWESKHRELKQVARATNSRINLPYTVIMKCMLRLAYRFLSGDGLRVEFSVGSTSPVPRRIIDPEGILHHFVDANEEIYNVAKWITVCGVYFTAGLAVHTAYTNGYPCFAKIEKIVYEGIEVGSLKPKIFFVCKELVTNFFVRHVYAFDVTESRDPFFALRYEDLVSPHPFVIRPNRNGRTYVSTRYDL
ncbi:uncharacterized protein LOC127751350 [Frankliniella occidentalis]|uniref:Uncharacterized protein LOC127751350 n=1 Tax=Frankliniella occidentalis TaxID=133901 RepID=A0A9C6X7N2_FRAOC|nr:uncharacterized protein LOC127751350 [Frankliniella occidentalis]